jgi:histidine triad (HIT) family protein
MTDSFTCPRCGATSHNPNDVREGYCGRCHAWTRDSPCVFCAIVEERAPAEIVRRWTDTIAIVPLNPVTPGHVLVIPHAHVKDAASAPVVAGLTMQRAAELAGWRYGSANIITSIGAEATQTVMHLHLHVVPRAAGDGLALPWTGQQR